MDNPTEISPPLSVQNKGENVTNTIATFAELEQFVRTEEETWRPFANFRGVHTATNIAIDKQLGWITNLKEHQENFASGNERGRVTARAQLQALLTQLEEGQVLSSTSVVGKRIVDLSKQNAPAAVMGLARELRLDRDRYPELNIQQARAVIVEHLDRYDLTSSIATYEKLFEETRNRFDNLLKEADVQFESMKTQMASNVAKAEKDRASALERQEGTIKELAETESRLKEHLNKVTYDLKMGVETEIANVSAAIAALKTSAETDIENFRASLRSQLRLQAPAAYWRVKASEHTKIAGRGLGAFIVAAGLLIVIFLTLVPQFMMDLPRDTAGNLYFGEFIVLTIPALAYFWIMRYLGRYFVSNFAAAADSRLRATMTETFLALAADGKSGIGDAERLIILQALFRAHSGAAEDDAPPSNLLDLMRAVTLEKK
jgi:F0F1-type ATP synthase membrane subunit b/b'